MASDTAPAAVPDPADPPTSTTANGPATGGITSLLTPVQPARPTSAAFTLDPANVAPGSLDSPAEAQAAGVSSAAFQNDADTQEGGKNGTGNGQQTGVMRAFALAAIERWKKGAGARNKRLDIQKAKAQQHQVKEARTVNRTEKMVGGSTNSGTTSGKSLDSKGQKTNSGSANGKNGKTSSGSGAGSSGRSGSGGSSASGGGRGTSGSKGGTGNGAGPNGRGTGNTRQPTGKSSGSGTTNAGGSKTNPSGKSGHDGKAGSAGKDGKTGKDTKPAPAKTIPQDTTTRRPWKKDPGNDTGSKKGGDGSTTQRAAKDTGAGKDGKQGKATLDKTAKPGTGGKDAGGTARPGGKVSLDKTSKSGKDNAGSKDDKPGRPGKPAPASTGNGKKIGTQPSREAGYRDGSRTAKAVAHAQAYKNGVKDGYRDTSESAQREQERLDKAHEARKQQRAKDQPVTASSADHQPQGGQPQGPQPIDVKEVTDKHVVLDGGQTHTRGEVRKLKEYERRMGEKATSMGRAAEGTRTLQAHAEQQAGQALKFLEMAKNVEGGDQFTGTLTRLHEAATIQIREAQELHKRVVRAAENTQVVLTNVETRYGGIYKAVCDSPLTKPAELNWYRK